MHSVILITAFLQVSLGAPQFITFKDGKIGVNFGGYHAEAGLGGLLTGNAAHGFLGASAGTPWGPQAAAGLGGDLNGRASGSAYASAQATPLIGASAGLGGTAGEWGFTNSEAHVNGRVSSKTKTVNAMEVEDGGVLSLMITTDNPQQTNVIQKVKAPKKLSLIKDHKQNDKELQDFINSQYSNANDNNKNTALHSKIVSKQLLSNAVAPQPLDEPAGNAKYMPPAQAQYHPHSSNIDVNTGLVGSVLNIPIGILRSLQDSLGGLHAEKTVSLNNPYDRY